MTARTSSRSISAARSKRLPPPPGLLQAFGNRAVNMAKNWLGKKAKDTDKQEVRRADAGHPAPTPSPAPAPVEAGAEAAVASPLTTMILTDIALRAGTKLLQRGPTGRVLARALPFGRAANTVKGPSLAGSLVGTALAKVATRSVPGAIFVGGGLMAKALYDRRKAKRIHAELQGKVPPKKVR